MPAAPALEVVELAKRYGRTTALDGLSFAAAAGRVTALLGPNGAGKTTAVEICEGYRRADSGTVTLLGRDPVADARAIRPRVGVMPQTDGIPYAVRPLEYLRLLARFHAHPLDPAALLELLGLTGTVRTPARRLSGGQRQRLSLAAAIIGRPELVFLDEPTAGLDPQARRATWELVRRLRADGVTLLLTTHYMDEAEQLADQVVIMDRGRVVAQGTPAELTGAQRQLRFRARPGLDLGELLTALPVGSSAKESPDGHYLVEGPGSGGWGDPGSLGPELLATVTAWCAAHGVMTRELRIESRTLEDVFLELTGRELR